MMHDTVAIIGAGPYGLSVAAHLKEQGISVLVFGKPMEFWQNMPEGLCLKSVWSASTLSDPAGKYSLDNFIAATHAPHQEPIPLPLFLDYTRWFQQHNVPNIDPTYVQRLSRNGNQFQLDLADSRTIKVDRVVVAAGISLFTYIPEYARALPTTLASHTQDHTDLTPFKGRNVAVVGSGQSALEYAALLHEVGASVELIARGPVLWVNRKLYDFTGPARHIFYPPSDVGPPGLNWLISYPLVFRRLPDKTRHLVDKRAVRPAGAKWLRSRVEGHVLITQNTQIIKATVHGQSLHLRLSDGTTREVDYLFLGTGYQPNLEKVKFLDPTLHQQVEHQNGYPLQNEWFESSVPNLYFIGAIAGHTFGPLCRFVAGAKIPAQQITRHVNSSV